MQAIGWLDAHGLGSAGTTCKCGGTFRFVDGDDHLKHSRCDNTECRARRSRRGEFFSHYHSTTSALSIMYCLSKRWRPATIKQELNKDAGRITAMLDHLGNAAQHWLELEMKAQCGTWDRAVFDETATGQAKKVRGARAGPATKKGLRWWLTMCKFDGEATGSK